MDAAGLENPDHADDSHGRFGHQEADAIAFLATGFLQRSRKLVAPPVQLTVSQSFWSQNNGDCVRAQFCLPRDPVMKQSVHESVCSDAIWKTAWTYWSSSRFGGMSKMKVRYPICR